MVLLLVDDQQSVLDGILAGVDWKALGSPEVLTANSALQAKEWFQAQAVDILVCDIEMPIENGLELFRWVRENYPRTEGIFLTSHAVFDYAQTALKLGSFEYLVQPIDYRELELSLKRLMNHIYNERENRGLSEIGTAVIENREVLVRHFWTNLILTESNKRLESIAKDILLLGIPADVRKKYMLVLLTVKDEHVSLGRWDTESAINNICALFSQCAELAGETDNVFFLQLDDIHLLAVMREQQNSRLYETLKLWLDACAPSLSIHCSCLASSAVPLNGLDKQYRKLRAFEESDPFVRGIVFPEHPRPPREEVERLSAMLAPYTDFESWIRFFSHGEDGKLREELESCLEKIGRTPGVSANVLFFFYQQIMGAFFASLRMRNVKEGDIYTTNNYLALLVRARNSADDLRAWFDALLEYNKTLPLLQGSTEHALVNQLKEYINAHLDLDLTRKELAEQVYLSESYVSHLFSKETGEPLADYITNRKIELAQNLLSTTSYPVSIIAVKAGYSNFSYFSKLFKKKTGLAPNEYRKAYGA